MKTVDLDDGSMISYIGPDLHTGKKSAVFYIALAAYENLDVDPYNQPAIYLAERDCRVFSLDLPFHGTNYSSKAAIASWADAFQQGEDPLKTYMNEVEKALNNLARLDLLDLEKTGLMGLSRGGLICPLVAKKWKKIGPILVFAPMTNLALAQEFASLTSVRELKQYDLLAHIEDLYYLTIRCYISNRDQRVDTKNCFNFLYNLANCAVEKGIRSPLIEMIMGPPAGQMGHGTLQNTFEHGANWLLKELQKE